MDFFRRLWETSHSEVFKKKTPHKNINTSKVEGNSKQHGWKGSRLEFLTLRFIFVCFYWSLTFGKVNVFRWKTPRCWKNMCILEFGNSDSSMTSSFTFVPTKSRFSKHHNPYEPANVCRAAGIQQKPALKQMFLKRVGCMLKHTKLGAGFCWYQKITSKTVK